MSVIRAAHAGFVRFADSAVEDTLAARFGQQVLRHPHRPAIVHDGRVLTYRVLDGNANGVARRIIQHGGAGHVALLFGHGAVAITAILGVLKAGRSYVPLEPSHPIASLDRALRHCEARLLLVDAQHEALAEQLAERSGVRVLRLDSDDSTDALEDAPRVTSQPGDIAALLHTSGSTGEPKTIVQTHRTILHHAKRYVNAVQVCPEDRLSLLSSYSYAASLTHLFSALLTGAALLPFDVAREGVSALADWLVDDGVTVYHSVPSVFRQLAERIDKRALPDLRLIRLGGEATLPSDVELYRRYLPDTCQLMVALAAGEVSLFRYTLVGKHTEIDPALNSVPLCQPAEDMEVVLLDERGREVARGDVGEIVVKSDYISAGYWRRSDLTDAAFGRDPRGGDGRVFHTRDLGRWLPDGSLLHVGRSDHRIKVRGVRVELPEVEAALRAHADVTDAAVVMRPESTGEPRLVAYVVRRSASDHAADVRGFLSERLPPQAIPSSFVRIQALPRTPNGKVDRAALAAADPLPMRAPEAEPPQTPVEATLAVLWSELLGVEDVGRLDDFFELGGHSLVAAELFARIEDIFDVRLPLSTLFPECTIAHLSRVIATAGAPSDGVLIPIQPRGSNPPFFCVHPLDGDVLRFAALARHLGSDQPLYALRAPGLEQPDLVVRDVASLAALYADRIERMRIEGPYLLGGFSFGGLVAVEIGRLLIERGANVGCVVVMDTVARISSFASLRRAARNVPTDVGNYARFLRRERQRRTSSGSGPNSDQVLAAIGAFSARHYAVALAHRAASAAYRPRPYPGQLVVFRAEVQRLLSRHDPTLGWGSVAMGGVEVHTVPGIHEQILQEPAVRVLAPKLAAVLQASRTRS